MMESIAKKSESLSVKSNIDKLTALESEMKKHKQVDIEIVHHFAPGVYCREMRVPKGVMLTGKIHKYAHMNIMSAGEATIVNESGKMRVKAPFSFVSEPGTKRAFYAHEDVVWTCIHPTEETDIEKIENEVIVESLETLKLVEEEE